MAEIATIARPYAEALFKALGRALDAAGDHDAAFEAYGAAILARGTQVEMSHLPKEVVDPQLAPTPYADKRRRPPRQIL